VQRDVHYCFVCNKTISRGNQASNTRHAESNHKNDRSYDWAKAIVSIDHKDAVAAMKKNELSLKDNKTNESEVEVEEGNAYGRTVRRKLPIILTADAGGFR